MGGGIGASYLLIAINEATTPAAPPSCGLARITVPTIVLHGEGDGVSPPSASAPHQRFFTGPYERRLVPIVGHNLPQEAPREFAEAIRELAHIKSRMDFDRA